MAKKDTVVVKIIKNDMQLVIDKGSKDGVDIGQTFLVYSIDPEPLIHPITKENLGILEIVKGTGKVIHVQESVATIESDKYTKPRKKTYTISPSNLLGAYGQREKSEEILEGPQLLPFEDPEVGDFAKRIK